MTARKIIAKKQEPVKSDLGRMLPWALLAISFYLLAAIVSDPKVQTLLWKYGNVTGAGYLGYWLDRWLSRRRIGAESTETEGLRRAIIVAAAMLAIGLGL